MKTTSRSSSKLLAFVIVLSGYSAGTAIASQTEMHLVRVAVVGQAESERADASQQRRKTSRLLKKARQAMKKGQLEQAESLLEQAEAIGAPYGFLYVGDTPKKVRHDLEKLKSRRGPKRPSQRFSATTILDRFTGKGPNDRAAASDPFSTRSAADQDVANNVDQAVAVLNDNKSRAKMYVLNGRRELTRNNLAAAKHWYRKAKQLGAQFDPEEDSPEKLLADIQAAGGHVEPDRTGISQSSQRATLAPPSDSELTRVPGGPMPNRLATPDAAGAPMQSDLARTPIIDTPPNNDPVGKIEALHAPSSSQPGQLRQTAHRAAGPQRPRNLLHAARLALAVGDIPRARSLTAQAKSLGVRSAHDSPERVEAALNQYEQIQQQRGRGPATALYRRQLALHLVRQAEALLAYGDFDEAERLAIQAREQRSDFNQFELKPDDLLQRIAAARQGQRSGPQTAREMSSVASTPSHTASHHTHDAAPIAGARADLQTTTGADSSQTPPGDSNEAKRQRVLALLRQARQAMAANQFDRAEHFARQAETLRLPNAAYHDNDDRPWLVLLELQRARLSGNTAAMSPPTERRSGVSDASASFSASTGGVEAAAFQAPLNNGQSPERGGMPQSDRSRHLDSVPGPVGNVPESGRAEQGLTAPETVAPQEEAVSPTPSQNNAAHPAGSAAQNLRQGEAALRQGDRATATRLLLAAYQERQQLDADSQRRLESYLTQLSQSKHAQHAGGTPSDDTLASDAQPATMKRAVRRAPETLIDDTTSALELAARQLSAELARRQQQAQRLRETDPATALSILREARKMVEDAQVDPVSQAALLRRVDRDIAEVERFINDHQALIQLDKQNRETLEQIEREQQVKIEIQEKLALLVDQYNQLMDEQRFAEAEVVAKKAQQLAPESQLAAQLVKQSRLIRQWNNQMSILDRKEDGVLNALSSTEESAIPQDDRIPIVFPDAKSWEDLTQRRRRTQPGERVRRSEAELEIEQKLRTPVLLQYEEAPLGQVMEHLAKVAGVNLHLDLDGLRQEGVDTNTPVTINLSQEISLKSALNLILEQHHLSYVIKDEVLKITSEAMRQGELYTVTYNVADLIVPIPNFSPGNRLGLEGSLANAYGQLGYGGAPFSGPGGAPLTVLAGSNGGTTNAMIDPNVLAQVGASGALAGGGGGGVAGGMGPMGFGPGGMGGGANADFDSLIELITTTIAPQTWEDVGGSGAIEAFPTNLSLVISQTEDVHQQIVELLDQLRRLQDLQVTIEVRFITLNDNFFERIGVDFDFDIDDDIDGPFQVFGKPDPNFQPPFDNSGTNPGRNFQDRDHGPSVTVGQSAPGVFSADLDIPFRQNSFGLAVPQFGGFDATAGAQLGFAILSDLEAFFFINAAQGDSRTNVLQAPKVTLFNGQQAFVADVSQSPFVISVIPVVGDFAAAQQPVIVVLNEGTFLTVQAVVSPDRRFVRLTLVPFFSQIGDVDTFTFTGSTTTTENSSSEGPEDNTTSRNNDRMTVTEGTTVQLPTFAFISVATTVSVPDGGSVLLGGIKRLNEGRREAGVPILNKMPYISRLFKNVGIGRETSSLMMMVTPRIIIQEEEEALLLGGN